jgi:hypothetical protein
MSRESSSNIFFKRPREFYASVSSPPHNEQTQIMTATKFLQNISGLPRKNNHKRKSNTEMCGNWRAAGGAVRDVSLWR